ncbi:hypothetical protein OC610_07815 [Pseudomonas sp. SAICEU22]|uniref:Uncharacterized protein n=1 Tax=Pseudomonas agronomica TaxID=2979328 RepID=A0ABT3F5G0_9PSED|nr:hypothetical protein [Pseudomonas agronomica]MCW1244308.1 hypothetical protein [Pseudomonas agronomica]
MLRSLVRMYISLKIDKAAVLNALLFFSYFALLLWVNNNYLYLLYDYMGASQRGLDGLELVYLMFLALGSSLLCGSSISKPGDIVVVLLFLIVVPHALVLNGANTFYPEASPFSGLSVSVLMGVALISIVNKVKFRPDTGQPNSGVRYLSIVSVINIIVLAFILLKSASFFSLDFSGQYVRRSIARDIFSPGSIEGYIASIGTQAFFPVLFAWGVYKKSKFFFWLGVINVLVLWGAFGQKYPFIVILFVYALMTYFRYNGKVNISWLLFGALGLLIAGCLEFELMGYSYLNDYLIRRVYTVPSTMLGAAELFYDSFGINGYSDTSIGLLSGVSKSESITFRIGEYIYNNPETNANVNFFAVAYLRLGYTAVIVETFIVSVIVMLLNFLYMKRSIFIAMPVALLFGTKIVEQSLPTVLLGSGVSFMLLLLMLMASSSESKGKSRSLD